MSATGRYRRVYSLDWMQAAFQRLDDGERVVCLYLQTGSQSTSVGCYRLSTAVAAEELSNLTSEQFDARREVVCEAMAWSFDAETRVLWIPEWLARNPPQSPNVVTSWRKLLENVPDCAVKAAAVDAIHRQIKELPEAFGKAFGSYRVSLSKGSDISKAKPKSQASSHQGSGIRDLSGIRDQGAGALRADGSDVSDIPSEVATVARQLLDTYGSGADAQTDLDTFRHLWKQEQRQHQAPGRDLVMRAIAQETQVYRRGLSVAR